MAWERQQALEEQLQESLSEAQDARAQAERTKREAAQAVRALEKDCQRKLEDMEKRMQAELRSAEQAAASKKDAELRQQVRLRARRGGAARPRKRRAASYWTRRGLTPCARGPRPQWPWSSARRPARSSRLVPDPISDHASDSTSGPSCSLRRTRGCKSVSQATARRRGG